LSSEEKKESIALRFYKEEDKPFIFSTWLKGLRHGNELFKLMESTSYFKNYHAIIEVLLAAPDTTVLVACLKDDEDVILGYSVFSGETVHWVHVKDSWRHIGIAKSLTPVKVSKVTHLTKVGTAILKKHQGAVFDPFALNS
jgi:hypothetical protein